MQITRWSLDNPIAVIVAILLICIFGLISLMRLPIQLTADIEEPGITVTTNWRAASPNEVETEIIEPQEDVLRGLPGMIELRSSARRGSGEISIRFAVGVDMRRALLEVINRLNQVPNYPDDADEVSISSVGADARAIAWFIIKPLPGNGRDITTYKDYVDEVVRSRFERVPGVARSNVYGGADNEIRITFDPYKAANLDIQLPKVAQLAGSAENISAGFQEIGKRQYSLRFIGKYEAQELGKMVLAWRDGYPVYLKDVAVVEKRSTDKSSFVLTKGSLSIAVNAQRESGVNVLQVMERLQQEAKELNEGELKRAGLSIEQVHDETLYIDRAVNMLTGNLGVGIFLATLILFAFLLKISATLMVTAAIPICLFFSFSVLELTGRTLNIISLAGLAFAVGLVLDASIVILENIIRLRERGGDRDSSAYQGVKQVWGALLASTATTIAIFLPVVFLQGETGQLFTDLAVTITAAVCMSLLSAVTIVPTATKFCLKEGAMIDPYSRVWDKLTGLIMALTNTRFLRAAWILGIIFTSIFLIYQYKPKADYLPDGNTNLVYAFILPPPGASIEYLEKEIGRYIADELAPYVEGGKQPQIRHYFFVAFSSGVFLGARAVEEDNAKALLPVINQVVQTLPDSFAFAKQSSLFSGFGKGRSIDMHIQGNDLEIILEATLQAFIMIPSKIEGANIRPKPGLELAQPELRLLPDERQIAEAGWNRAIVANISRALGDGLYVGEYFDGEKSLNLILRARAWQTPEELAAMPLATPNAGILAFDELVDIERAAGPEEIQRINRRRTVTLEITPPPNVSLEETLAVIKEHIEPAILEKLSDDGNITYGGVADKLSKVLQSMSGSFVLAVIILYLLMSALFHSFKSALLVILALPVATVGGVLALRLLNFFVFQPMDLLTMIGFIILLGLVVNNAILLVQYSRTAEREGLPRRQTVENAVHLRLRPIMMSTLTSIFGMLPLMLVPGAGTELYRGLATVIVGGMIVSTLFTLVLLPSLLRIGESRRALEN